MLNDGTTQHKLIYAYNHTSAINFFAERFRLSLATNSKITAIPQRLMDKVERDGKVITRKQAELLDREQDWLQSLYNRMNMTACSEFYLSKRVSKDSLVQFLDASISPVTDIYKAKLFPFAEASASHDICVNGPLHELAEYAAIAILFNVPSSVSMITEPVEGTCKTYQTSSTPGFVLPHDGTGTPDVVSALILLPGV
jgi:hypothetical protein